MAKTYKETRDKFFVTMSDRAAVYYVANDRETRREVLNELIAVALAALEIEDTEELEKAVSET